MKLTFAELTNTFHLYILNEETEIIYNKTISTYYYKAIQKNNNSIKYFKYMYKNNNNTNYYLKEITTYK
jgi:hypothetical protein